MLTQSQVIDIINQITLSIVPYGGINTIMCIIMVVIAITLTVYLVNTGE